MGRVEVNEGSVGCIEDALGLIASSKEGRSNMVTMMARFDSTEQEEGKGNCRVLVAIRCRETVACLWSGMASMRGMSFLCGN